MEKMLTKMIDIAINDQVMQQSNLLVKEKSQLQHENMKHEGKYFHISILD